MTTFDPNRYHRSMDVVLVLILLVVVIAGVFWCMG
jgi:hypothetical protein